MIDTAELYSLVLVYVILTLIQGHWDARKQKVMCKLSPRIMNW